MKKKLTILFVLITISMVGIIYFQVEWVITTYKLETRRINTEAESALSNAVLRLHKDHNDATLKTLLPLLQPLADSVKIKFTGDGGDFLVVDKRVLASNSDSLTITLRNKDEPSLATKNQVRSMASYNIGRVKINYPFIVYTIKMV